jgi:hypothetical protein
MTYPERWITLSVDYGDDGAVRISAECADEVTSVYVIGDKQGIVPIPDKAALAGDYGRMLVLEHQAQCASCQRWAAA